MPIFEILIIMTLKNNLPRLFLASTMVLGGFSVYAGTIPEPSYADYSEKMPCVNRVGRCFDAMIGGQPVVVIEEKSEHDKLIASFPATTAQVRRVYWHLAHPVSGKKALDIYTQPNIFGIDSVGKEEDEPDVSVFPLDGQKLKSEMDSSTVTDARSRRQAVVTQQETLTEDHLPPGRYIFSIKFVGTKNWDRKWIFVQVR